MENEYSKVFYDPASPYFNFGLSEKHLASAKVLDSRTALLKKLPEKSRCAELGIAYGVFSRHILEVVKPSMLMLVDVNPDFINLASLNFSNEIKRGQVVIRQQMSHLALEEVEDKSLDWVFIDTDHNYETARIELDVAARKVAEEGLIILHDYILYSYHENRAYGIVKAVNEFCVLRNYSIHYLVLEPHMYNTVALKKIFFVL